MIILITTVIIITIILIILILIIIIVIIIIIIIITIIIILIILINLPFLTREMSPALSKQERFDVHSQADKLGQWRA
jgi:hypothetical protein